MRGGLLFSAGYGRICVYPAQIHQKYTGKVRFFVMKNTKTTKTKTTTKTPALSPMGEIITAENVQKIGELFAVKSLKKYYEKSGMPFVYTLYAGLIGDIYAASTHEETKQYCMGIYAQAESAYKAKKERGENTEKERAIMDAMHKAVTGHNFSDGYDVAQTAICALWVYAGKSLSDPIDGETKTKTGELVTVKTAVFRAISKYVHGERVHEYKRVFVDDMGETGELVYHMIPEEWDMPSAHDYTRVCALMDALNLPPRQAQVLKYRLRGVGVLQERERENGKQSASVKTIAEKMGVNRRADYNLLEKI